MPLRFRMEFVLNPQPPAATTIGQIKNWIQRCFNLEPEFIGLRVQGFDDEPDNGDDLGFLDVDDNTEEITVTVNPDALAPFQAGSPQSVAGSNVVAAVASAPLMESGGSDQNILDSDAQEELRNILALNPQNMVAPGPSQPGPSQPGPSKRASEFMDPAEPTAEPASKRLKFLEDGAIQMPVRLKPTGLTTMPIEITSNDTVKSFTQKIIDLHELPAAGVLSFGGTELRNPDQNLFEMLVAYPQFELEFF